MKRAVTVEVMGTAPFKVTVTGMVRSFISSSTMVTTSARTSSRRSSSALPSASYASARPSITPWY